MSCTNLFGLITLGDCEAKAESITKELNKTVNKVINDHMVKQISEDRLSTQQINEIIATTKIGNITISDVDMTQEAVLNLKSLKSSQSEADVKNMMSQIAKQLAQKTAKAVKAAGGTKVTTKSVTNIQNIMENELVSKVSAEQVNQCVGSVYQKNRIAAHGELSDITIIRVNMKQTANAIADCVGQNVSQALFASQNLQDALQDVTEDLSVEGKGPFSWLTDIFGGFTNMFMIGGIILVVLLLLAGIGFLIFTSMGGIEKVGAVAGQGAPGAPSAGAPAPQSYGYPQAPAQSYGYPQAPAQSYGYPQTGVQQYSYTPGQYGYGLGKLEPSFWAQLTEKTYPVLSRFFNLLS